MYVSTDNIPQPDPRKNARRTDPATSRAAAYGLSDKRSMMLRLLFAYGRARWSGLTAEEAAAKCGYDPGDGAWKRVSDLKRERAIADKRDEKSRIVTRPGASGRQQNVLVITRLGQLMLEEEE